MRALRSGGEAHGDAPTAGYDLEELREGPRNSIACLERSDLGVGLAQEMLGPGLELC